MSRDEDLALDPECARCGAPLTVTGTSVVRDAQTYCCVNCARADAAEIGVIAGAPGGRACSRCGAPIADRTSAVAEGAYVFCCANCSAVGIKAEPLPER
jgi:endogenous inhibitor of DNA gyrase (YacG/DUF329 family)